MSLGGDLELAALLLDRGADVHSEDAVRCGAEPPLRTPALAQLRPSALQSAAVRPVPGASLRCATPRRGLAHAGASLAASVAGTAPCNPETC